MISNKKININGNNIDLIWDARDQACFEIIQEDWRNQSNEWLSFVPRRHTVIQAGGNCGLYPLYLSYAFKRVFTFEPDPVNFFCLASNCKNSKIIKINAAVTGEAGFVKIGAPDVSNNGMHKIGAGSTVVYGMTIDSLNLNNVDFLLLDIESFEYWALLGGMETINRCRPTIVAEITEKETEIIDLLVGLGYFHKGFIKANTNNHIFIPKEQL
jgi:FkbM family methyltransferase